MTILVLNIGSSSLKFSLFRQDQAKTTDVIVRGKIEMRDQQTSLVSIEVVDSAQEQLLEIPPTTDLVSFLFQWLTTNSYATNIALVAHRIVHGGTKICSPTIVDQTVLAQLAKLIPLAPLHMPKALTAIGKIQSLQPELRQAVFVDTAYFQNLPDTVIRYPLPHSLFAENGIRKFGFHGISHQYCSQRATELLSAKKLDAKRLIICHIGSGCSITAVCDQKPIDTTMGFTPLDGLMMATRSGSVDPGIIIYLQTELGWSVEKIDRMLNKESGLLGVSQVSSDFRELAKLSESNADASIANEMFADRIRKTIGAFAVQLNGLDALVFTAGIGENSAQLREKVCCGLQCLGVHLDAQRNSTAGKDDWLHSDDSKVAVLKISTQEEHWIAQQAFDLWPIES